MLTPGNILYFDEYYFRSGNPAKAKYLIVLATMDNDIIIHSLPTRTDTVPSNWVKKHGCNEDSNSNLSFYHFPKDIVITDTSTNFFFQQDTYLLGEHVTSESLEYFNGIYDFTNNCRVMGRLLPMEFENIVKCFQNSCMVKRKFKRSFIQPSKS